MAAVAPVKHPSSRRTVLAILLALDIVVLEICVLLGIGLRGVVDVWFPITLASSTFQGIYLAVLLLPAAYFIWGLYPGYGLSPVELLRRRTLITLVGFGLMSVYDHLAQNGQWSRGVVLIAMVISLVVVPLFNMLGRVLLMRLRLWGEPVALLGEPDRLQSLAETLRASPELGWIPAAAEQWPPGENAQWDGIETAILLPPRTEHSLATITEALPFRKVMVIPDFGGNRSLGISAQETGIGLGLEIRNSLLYPINRLFKRYMDVLAAVLLLPAALLVVGLFAMAVKLVSPGPAFFGQWREGQGGFLFRVWKIRSMVPNAEMELPDVLIQDDQSREQWQTHKKLADDPRVIPGLGRFMRRFSIDELPQIYNVLIGEMSLVGPRPLPPYHLDDIPRSLVGLRRQVRPGITGWAQISGRSNRTVLQQVECDAYYIRNWSFWVDIYVLLRTMGVVVSARGAY